MFNRRLQILIDEQRFRRIESEARDRKTSVAAVIRDAIDLALPPRAARWRAARTVLSAETMEVPGVEDLRAEREAAHART